MLAPCKAVGVTAPELAAAIAEDAVPAPAGDDDAAWSEYLGALEATERALEALLTAARGATGERVRAALAASAGAPAINEVLGAFVLQRQLEPGLDTAATEALRETASRVLARLELPAGAPLPADLEALAKAIVLAPSVERAEALATELRRAVQAERDAQDARRSEMAEALRRLDALPDGAPAALVAAHERVSAGVARLDAELRDATDAALAAAAASRASAACSAAGARTPVGGTPRSWTPPRVGSPTSFGCCSSDRSSSSPATSATASSRRTRARPRWRRCCAACGHTFRCSTTGSCSCSTRSRGCARTRTSPPRSSSRPACSSSGSSTA